MPRIYNDDLKELPNIPDRFGEANWRRFEPVIKEFLKRFPQPLVFRPKNISAVTAVARLRDAVRAFLHPTTNWESEVEPALLFTYWPQVAIRQMRDGTVAIGPDREISNIKTEDKIEKLRETVYVDASNEELFLAAACCKHHEVIIEPLTVVNATDEQIVLVTERYPNAPIIDNGDGTHTIV